jgi:ABC-2 type transport system permease protein
MLILGVSYGSILGDLEGFINSSELIRQMIPEIAGKGMTESFITMLMTILSILGTIPVLLFILRLKGEEKKGRTEQILAAAVSRKSLLASFAAIGLMAIPLIQLMSVLGLWSSAAFVMEDPLSFSTIIKLGLVHLPAMLFMAALAVVLIGFLPGLTGLVWLYLGYSFFVVYMGEMLKLPNWLEKLSPFGHIPQLPLEGADIARLSIMAGLAIALIVAGFIGYRQRDIQG